METEVTREEEIKAAVKRLNIKWSEEDLENALEENDMPVTRENMAALARRIDDRLRENLITSINDMLADLAYLTKMGMD